MLGLGITGRNTVPHLFHEHRSLLAHHRAAAAPYDVVDEINARLDNLDRSRPNPVSEPATTTPAPKQQEKREFHSHMQLRSVLALQGAAPHADWVQLLTNQDVRCSSSLDVHVALPSTEQAESCFRATIVQLAEALTQHSVGPGFYRHFGWTRPEQLFEQMGEQVVMLVDTDHNDTDDRLAIILLAYMLASANNERRQQQSDATCRLFLDIRSYESEGLVVWRTAALAARLNDVLQSAGVQIQLVLTHPAEALQFAAKYMKLPAEAAALDRVVSGAATAIDLDSCSDLSECWATSTVVSIWLLSGVCKNQVEDIKQAVESHDVQLVVMEQAQPAWQSMHVDSQTTQPAWDDDLLAVRGYGAEPSNVRAGVNGYSNNVLAYMRLQQLFSETAGRVRWCCLGLARSTGYMPVPPGEQMVAVQARPLNVRCGKEYEVVRAVEPSELSSAFAALQQAAEEHHFETLHAELSLHVNDDHGDYRDELVWIARKGSYMADGISICLLGRPVSDDHAMSCFTRRLAFVQMPTD